MPSHQTYTAHNKAKLSRWIGRYGGIAVFSIRKHLLAKFVLEVRATLFKPWAIVCKQQGTCLCNA